MPAPTLVDFDALNNVEGAGTSVVVDWSALSGLADNDIVIVPIYKEHADAYTATPSGWNQVSGAPWNQDTGGFKFMGDLWWRRRSGDSGTATWSWTNSVWRARGTVSVWRGCITSEAPLLGAVAEEEAAQNTEPGHPGITVARSNSGLLKFVFNNTASAVTTLPTGFSDVSAVSFPIQVFYDLTTTPGATGAINTDLVDPEWPLSVVVELVTEAAAGGGAAAVFRPGNVFVPAAKMWPARRPV